MIEAGQDTTRAHRHGDHPGRFRRLGHRWKWWQFGWGAQDDRDSITAIRHAIESGTNWIDTAAVYGLGHSEEVIARAVRDLPEVDRPFVFTKGGRTWEESDPSLLGRSGKSLRREVERSLRRLEVEWIDLYQVHWPTDGASLEDYWQTFVHLRAEGKIRSTGLCNHNTGQLRRAEAIGHVDSLQPPFNLIQQDVGTKIISWCAEHGAGVIVYSPMAPGLLTGAFSENRASRLDSGDWRSSHPNFTGEGLKRNLAIARGLEPAAQRHG